MMEKAVFIDFNTLFKQKFAQQMTTDVSGVADKADLTVSQTPQIVEKFAVTYPKIKAAAAEFAGG